MEGTSWVALLSDQLDGWLAIALEAGLFYGGLLALAVLAITVLFRRWLSPSQMGLMWGLVLLRLAIPVAPPSPLGLENLWPRDDDRIELRTSGHPAVPVPAVSAVPDYARPWTLRDLQRSEAGASEEPDWLETMLSTIPLIWIVVGSTGLAITIARYARFCRRVNRATPCRDERILRLWKDCSDLAAVRRSTRVLEFDGVDQAAVMGLLRPILLLPASTTELADQQLRMVMLHELAHVRRWDIASNWCLLLVRAIHWWNPVYWLAAARFRSLREQACDAFVVRTLEGDASQGYAELLLALAERRPSADAWRVMLPASILSFFPSWLRRRAVQIRLKSLRMAGKRSFWHSAIGAALLLMLGVSGFTSAREEVRTPVDISTWMAMQPVAVTPPKRSYVEEQVYAGPHVTRTYDIAQVIKRMTEKDGSAALARQSLLLLLRQFFPPNPDATGSQAEAPPSRTAHQPLPSTDASHDTPPTNDELEPPRYEINGTTLSATAPIGVHERLARAIEAWNERGLTQISVETRFVSADRDLAADLGVSWQFMEAFSGEPETEFPSTDRDGGPVVRAEARVDEYLPLVVSTLDEPQMARLIQTAQADARANLLFAPKVTLFNGMEATIADCVQRPFVVGVFQPVAGANQPKVVVLEEGTRIKVRAVQGRKKVHLQASIEMKSMGEVATASALYRGDEVTIQVPSVNRRCIDVGADLEEGQTLLVGSIPTGKQQQYWYYLLTARFLDESPQATATSKWVAPPTK